MFLRATLHRNLALVEAAARLHRSGEIGPNTFVIDIDRVLQNARLISSTAAELGLRVHVMTKQQGRNPFLALAAVAGGIPDAVTVDVAEARVMNLHGIPIGHVGHLVQVPARDTDEVVGMRPGAVTVFSLEAARRIGDAATRVGRTQDVLLRVWKPGDFIYPGQEGGFRTDEAVAAARRIAELPGVRISGVTSFPCLLWDDEAGEVRDTGNLASVVEVAHALRNELGSELAEINAPGVTAVGTLTMIARRGATHGEPGSSLTAHTPLHVTGEQPETPAMVFVSEVASVDGGFARCFGGGFYARSRVREAAIVDRSGELRVVPAVPLPPEVIDYYGTLETGTAPVVGATVVFAFRSQVFVGRCQVAAVGGIASGRPEVLGICDQHGNLLGTDQLPVGASTAREWVADRWRRYLGATELNGRAVAGGPA
jgi:predicted amino acid racemase